MDRFYLNPFIFIAQDKEHYFINASDGQTFILSDEQADALIGRNVFSRKELEDLFEIAQLKKLWSLSVSYRLPLILIQEIPELMDISLNLDGWKIIRSWKGKKYIFWVQGPWNPCWLELVLARSKKFYDS